MNPWAKLSIKESWNGRPLPESEHVSLKVELDAERLTVEIDAPYHGDPPPPTPAGRCDRLWDHEVVELFLVGPDEKYLELEFGPHGHYLALTLHGPRNVVDDRVPVNYLSNIGNGRWSGRAQLDASRIPRPVERWNAFAIHGVEAVRRYDAAYPLRGTAPDFHRIGDYPSLLLGGISPQEFLDTYWQKRSCLIRGAIPNPEPLVTRERLFELAGREESHSRVIHAPQADRGWSDESGPFEDAWLKGQPSHGWTLLVQEVDRYVPGCANLLDRFRFVPNWRVDDVMVSFAVDGGGVGPHIDRYDVFLLQAAGRRRWRISTKPMQDPRLRMDVDFAMLAEFEPDEEWLLEPGDMLYLPPRVAHEGTAEGEAITCSIGFRTPDPRDFLFSYLTQLRPALVDAVRYDDPDLRVAASHGEIPAAARERFRERAGSLFAAGGDFDRWLGCHLTTPFREETPQASGTNPVRSVEELWDLLERGARLERCAITQLAWLRDSTGDVIFFGAGEDYSLGPEGEELAELLCGRASLDAVSLSPHRQDAKFATLLIDLILRSVLYVNCH